MVLLGVRSGWGGQRERLICSQFGRASDGSRHHTCDAAELPSCPSSEAPPACLPALSTPQMAMVLELLQGDVEAIKWVDKGRCALALVALWPVAVSSLCACVCSSSGVVKRAVQGTAGRGQRSAGRSCGRRAAAAAGRAAGGGGAAGGAGGRRQRGEAAGLGQPVCNKARHRLAGGRCAGRERAVGRAGLQCGRRSCTAIAAWLMARQRHQPRLSVQHWPCSASAQLRAAASHITRQSRKPGPTTLPLPPRPACLCRLPAEPGKEGGAGGEQGCQGAGGGGSYGGQEGGRSCAGGGQQGGSAGTSLPAHDSLLRCAGCMRHHHIHRHCKGTHLREWR